MGMTAKISLDMLGLCPGCPTLYSFHETITDSMNNLEKVFSSDWWVKIQMRLNDQR